MRIELIAVFLVMFLLGYALPADVIAVSVLIFLLGFNAQYVLAAAWRGRRRKIAPRNGQPIQLNRPHGPQAVRKGRQA